MNHRHAMRATFAAAVAGLAATWTAPAAAETACLKGLAPNKMCVDLGSVPGDTVQPSGLAGTPTYVKYTATIRVNGLASSRNIALTLDLSPATGFVSIEPEAGLACSITGSNVSCLADKLDGANPLTLVAIAEAPRHPTTVTELVNTAEVGWNGNTATAQRTVEVSETAGRTYVPANTEVTLVTSPEAADPAEQVTPDAPLWGKVTLPPQPVAYYARVAVIGDGPAAANCTGGLFLSATDGGPYVCRNEQDPNRWVQFDVGATPGFADPVLFGADDPMQFTMMWDASIVPATQLPPTPALPTGAPPFAVFYSTNDTPTPPTVVARAFADTCEATGNAPPCLTGVDRFATGDWRASGLKTTDGSDLVAAARTPLERLFAALDYVVAPAGALGIKPPIMQ